mgnify:CR=1 FL=1
MSKVILLTGTSSGFGAHAAPLLAEKGHRVYATMRDPEARNKAAAAALRAKNSNIAVLELELEEAASIQAAVDQIIAREGRVDVLINNAGRFYMGVGESFTDQDLQHIYNVDVLGPWRLTRAVLPHMRQRQQGYILTVTSGLARFSCPFMTAYASAKHALEGLLQGMKYELKPFNIDITFIEPGIYPTQVFERSGRGSDVARNAGYGPAGEIAEQIKGQLDGLFASGKAHSPMLVAQAMADLVDTPAGRRPIRKPVDLDSGAFIDRLNATHEEEYAKYLTAAGMGGLL